MRKNIKTCIYIVTAILPIVLSACSNKTEDTNTLKAEKKSTVTTTFVEDTSSDITSTIEETTTEEDTTELISETEQEVINSTENIIEQQQTQANIQQTTIITSVNSTPVPVQTTPAETTTPRPTETTTPIEEYPNPTLTVKGVNKGEKYSDNDIEFTINSIEHSFHSIGYDGYCAIEFDINISSTEFISPYCIYNIYNSNDDCIETGTITFSHSHIENDYKVSNGHFLHTKRIPSDDFTIVIEFPNSQLKQ